MSEPTQPPQTRSGSPGAAVLGGILIVLGLIFFAGNQLNLDIGKAAWPLYVIAPGVAFVTLGLTQRNGSGSQRRALRPTQGSRVSSVSSPSTRSRMVRPARFEVATP